MSGGAGASVRTAQAWVELLADDPGALSALAVARARLPAGRSLTHLRRVRLIELRGALASREEIADLLRRSTRFFNPHKERCAVRLEAGEGAPVRPGEAVVLVAERGGERRPAAERWWLHETGERIEVREGVAWILSFESGGPGAERVEELARLRDRRHGLLCNPHSQHFRVAIGSIPLPWLAEAPESAIPEGAS